MALSMTGYGRSEAVLHGRNITVEIKSVNSRYFEYTSRIPRGAAFLDDKIKQLLAEKISRGKVEVSLQMTVLEGQTGQLEVDWDLADRYAQVMQKMGAQLGVKDDATASVLCRMPEVIRLVPAKLDEEQLWQDVQSVCSSALERFIQMREREGEKLTRDILSRLDVIGTTVGKLEQNGAQQVEAYTQRLYTKLTVLLEDKQLDDARILTEAAIFADKTAVDEETVRLRSHLGQYREILAAEGPVGRKLDFLTQELNREINTIGSKCNDLSMTRMVVDTKAEIEKIREQVQNIE